MKFLERVKQLVMKKPASSNRGQSASEFDNPYLNARRTWNHLMLGLVSKSTFSQVFGLIGVLMGLAAIGGMIHIGSLSKFIPYIVEVDKLGTPAGYAPAQAAKSPDQRVIRSQVSSFIADSRSVTPDISLQRKMIFRVYAVLSPTDAAAQKMNDWLNGSADSTPFKRAATQTVSVDIRSAMPQTPDTWQVEWTETTRDRQGVLKGKPEVWRALVTVYVAETTTDTTEEKMQMNPINTFVRDFTWSKQL